MQSHLIPVPTKSLTDMTKEELIEQIMRLRHEIRGKQSLIDKMVSDAGWAADARRDEQERERLSRWDQMGS